MATDTRTAAKPGIAGGSPTVFVSDLDRAVEFYTNTLGLSLRYRAGEHFAMIDAGRGFMIGLHPPGERTPAGGTSGNIQIGLTVDEPIEQVVRSLQARGVRFEQRDGGTVVNDDGSVKLAFFHDPDGTELYLCEVPPA
jgi:catechol 2,3-dioxygenase-like lactoylglutathione lyase family enzyme